MRRDESDERRVERLRQHRGGQAHYNAIPLCAIFPMTPHRCAPALLMAFNRLALRDRGEQRGAPVVMPGAVQAHKLSRALTLMPQSVEGAPHGACRQPAQQLQFALGQEDAFLAGGELVGQLVVLTIRYRLYPPAARHTGWLHTSNASSYRQIPFVSRPAEANGHVAGRNGNWLCTPGSSVERSDGVISGQPRARRCRGAARSAPLRGNRRCVGR